MGDLQVSLAPLSGAIFADDRLCSSPLSPPLPASNPDPSSVAVEAWSSAERTTHEILCRIQPTLGANQRRREVVEFVQRLIKYSIGCEVFSYGSVPLKTYLPDGDIDLTAFSCQNMEDALIPDVHAILRGEESREGADFEVKDVRFIDAEVKLVKCIVQNIIVDISFNQLGGLSTLCFLEQTDRLVGKDHLFKRSIILIKAWCYYESRILGAHHGLISTYALETLVLYIFHQFHSSLNGPLAVLYRFLDYFSKFDWENYCVSLKGPVSRSSLPDIVVEVPENEGSDILLTEEFIRNSVELFSVPSREIEPNLRIFPLKHLNIIDPLKENNNLGRSINRGNFYRIRSAFKYGARKLGWILMLPEDRIADELSKFFENTLGRHGSTQWDDMRNPSLAGSTRGSDFLSSPLDTSVCSEDMAFLSLSISVNKNFSTGNQFNSEIKSERETYPVKDVTSQVGLLYGSAGDGNATLGYNLGIHSKNVATAGALGMTNTNGSYCSDARRRYGALVSESSNLQKTRENGNAENWLSCRDTTIDSNFDDEKKKRIIVSNPLSSDIDEKDVASYGSEVSNAASDIFDNSCSPYSDKYSAGSSEGYKAPKLLLELSGDFDSHVRNLQYGQICNGYAISPPVMPSPPHSPNLQNINPWEVVHRSIQTNHNIHSQPNSNSVAQVYIVNYPTLLITGENRRPRGTGAYWPNMTSCTYRDRPSQGRGRNQAPGPHGQLHRFARNNGLALSPAEVKLPKEGSFEHALEVYPVIGSPKPRSLENHFCRPSMRGAHHANDFPRSSEKMESGHVSSRLHGPQRTEVSSHPQTGTSQGSVSSTGVLPEENSKSLSGVDHKRIEVKTYRLKNEDDFPPLSH